MGVLWYGHQKDRLLGARGLSFRDWGSRRMREYQRLTRAEADSSGQMTAGLSAWSAERKAAWALDFWQGPTKPDVYDHNLNVAGAFCEVNEFMGGYLALMGAVTGDPWIGAVDSRWATTAQAVEGVWDAGSLLYVTYKTTQHRATAGDWMIQAEDAACPYPGVSLYRAIYLDSYLNDNGV